MKRRTYIKIKSKKLKDELISNIFKTLNFNGAKMLFPFRENMVEGFAEVTLDIKFIKR